MSSPFFLNTTAAVDDADAGFGIGAKAEAVADDDVDGDADASPTIINNNIKNILTMTMMNF